MKEKKITILGSGTMGTGIAQLFAQYGFKVILIDIAQSQLDKARESIKNNLRYLKLTQSLPDIQSTTSILSAISFNTELDGIKGSEFIIENITENWEKKEALYSELKQKISDNAILGINTSAISITKLGALIDNPERVIGMHFMNPAPLMPMVEVIKGYHTDEMTINKTRSLLKLIQKKMVLVKDSVGFISNRAMMIFINEAIFMLQENIASIEDIDILFKQCFGHKMGPLQTADLIGLDTVLYSLENLYSQLNDPKYRPCWLLKNMVDAGLYGQKTKKGFYQYQ